MSAVVKGVVPWFGGKHWQAKHILPLLPPHKCYVEGFAGGARIFFSKPPSDREVLNDLNGELTRFYRVIANHPGAVLDELAEMVVSRAEFYALKESEVASLTDVQRAARFFYLQRLCYAAKPDGRYFSPGSNKAWNMVRRDFDGDIRRAHERLRHAVIENLPFERVVPLYDAKDTFYYMDPPYIEVCQAYGFPFSNDDQRRLAECLLGIEGQFMLSINDHALSRELYDGCDIRRIECKYPTTARSGRMKVVGELIVLGPPRAKPRSRRRPKAD